MAIQYFILKRNNFYLQTLKCPCTDLYYLVTDEMLPGWSAARIWTQPQEDMFIKKLSTNGKIMYTIPQLDHLQPGRTRGPAAAISMALDLLNMDRLHKDFDSYGDGLRPWKFRPTCIIHFTNGEPHIAGVDGAPAPTKLPPSLVVGADLAAGNLRWDQRVYSVVLKLDSISSDSGNPQSKTTAVARDKTKNTSCASSTLDGGGSSSGVIANLCEETGGFEYECTSTSNLEGRLDKLVTRITDTIGVGVTFEALPEEEWSAEAVRKASEGWLKPGRPTRVTGFRLLHNPDKKDNERTHTYWPLPEPYWPDNRDVATTGFLPPRATHPVLLYHPVPDDKVMIVEGMAFNKYKLEPSPLTQWIGSHVMMKYGTNFCFKVYVRGSGLQQTGSALGHPFGYLKMASGDPRTVNLYVFPYNYETLRRLVEQLRNINHPGTPLAPWWKSEFQAYLSGVPPYYTRQLKIEMEKISPEAASLIALPKHRRKGAEDLIRAARHQHDETIKELSRANVELVTPPGNIAGGGSCDQPNVGTFAADGFHDASSRGALLPHLTKMRADLARVRGEQRVRKGGNSSLRPSQELRDPTKTDEELRRDAAGVPNYGSRYSILIPRKLPSGDDHVLSVGEVADPERMVRVLPRARKRLATASPELPPAAVPPHLPQRSR